MGPFESGTRRGRIVAFFGFGIISVSVCAGLASAQEAARQETTPEVVEQFIGARAIEKPAPRYPRTAANAGAEGWVIVSYVVSKDGDIVEPMIEDSSGREDLERAALEVLEDWKYEPARINGEAADQSMTRARILFKLELRPGEEPGAGQRFVRSFRRIGSMIEHGDLDDAKESIEELRYSQRLNLYEDAWFWWLNYQYLDAAGEGESNAARNSLLRALGYEEDYLAADTFVAAAERLFALLVRSQDFSAALGVHARLTESKSAQRSEYFEPVTTQMMKTVAAIRNLIDGPETLEVTGLIGEHGYWVHDLLRRSFSIVAIDGEVEAVDLRCRRGTTRYSNIGDGNAWTVPESWGSCGVYIKGTEGTTFKFHEHPDTQL